MIDANGCIDFDQTAFTPVSYNAGPDQNYCLGGPGIQLGTVPEPTTTFLWTPASGLSCTTCPNPIATPSAPTTYTVTQTVPTKGGSCTVTDAVTITPLGPPNNNVNFAGPDTTICRGGTATFGTPADPNFFYVWSPTTYLGGTAYSAIATFNPGGNVQPPCPMTYTLTAYRGTCAFTDQTVVSVINPDLDQYGPVCGPVWVNGAGPTSCAGTVYSWSLMSGSGSILALSGGGADALLKNNGPGTAVFQRTSTLNGTTCTKQVTLATSCPPGCNVGINVLSPQGCAKVFPGMPLQLGVVGWNPAIYTIKWRPANLVSDSTGPVVNVLTNVPTMFTVTLTNIYDPTDSCNASIFVNKPTDTLPVFNAPNVTTCPGTPVGIGLAPLAGYTYLWMTNPTLSCLPCSNPTATPLATQTYYVTMTNTTTGCKGTDTVLATVTSPIANAGPNMTVCNGATVTLGTPDPSAGAWNYSWSPPASPWQNGTNQNSAQPQVLYSSLVPLTYSLIVTDPVTGCQAFDTVVLSSVVAPGSMAGMTDTICPGDTVMLGAPPMPGYTYSWSPASFLSCSNCAQPLAYPPGTTTYVVSAIAPGCAQPIRDTVTLVMSTLPTLSFLDRTICPTPGAAMGVGAPGNPPSVPGVASWLWSPASFLSCTACANPVANPPSTTTYYVTATTTAGCVKKDTLVVTPTIAVSAGADKNICPNGSAVIGTPAVPGVTYAWSPAGGLSCTNCAQPTANPAVTTTYYLNATNGPCTVVDSVVVSVGVLAPISLNSPPAICAGNCTTIGFFGNVGYTYQWVPTTGLASPTSPTTVACPTSTTTYTLVQTQTATGCASQAAVTVSVFGNAPTATGGLDTLCAGSSAPLILTVGPSGPSYSYAWTPPGGLNSPYIQNPVATPTFTTTYTVTVTNVSTGCSDTANATVVVLDAMDCLGKDFGDLPNVYETAGVAMHGIDTALRIGAVEDGEIANVPAPMGAVPNGDDVAALSDEDGMAVLPFVTTATNYVALPVSAYNNTGAPARITAWMDWNGDGDFADVGETSSTVTLSPMPSAQLPLLVWSGFNGSGQTLGGTTYLRIRIHPSSLTPSPNGAMVSGEVEDYRLIVLGEDFGDASPLPVASASVNPDQNNDGAPDATGSVWLGPRVDYVEFAPIGNPTATGDDVNGTPDDEDGVTIAMPSGGSPGGAFNATAGVSSQGALIAKVGVWVDFNADGDFVDAVDYFQQNIVNSTGAGVTNTTVSTTIPVGGSGNGAIVRVGVKPATAPNFTKTQTFGTLSILNGEWEDNIEPGVPLGVKRLDFSALAVGRSSELVWDVEEAEGVAAYSVLRSKDGAEWETTSVIESRGGSGLQRYGYRDDAPVARTNYYRIGLVSRAGVVERYSAVARVDFGTDAQSWSVVVDGGVIRLRARADEGAAGYAVYAGNGAVVARGMLVEGGVADVAAGSTGVYLVRVVGGRGRGWVERVVVR